jgi:hypothetical protein
MHLKPIKIMQMLKTIYLKHVEKGINVQKEVKNKIFALLALIKIKNNKKNAKNVK